MTILKTSIEDQMREMEIDRLTIKSKVLYQGNFREDLEKLVESMEPLVAEQVIKKYWGIYWVRKPFYENKNQR